MEDKYIEKATELLQGTTQEEQVAILKVLSPLMDVVIHVEGKGYRIDTVMDIRLTQTNTYGIIPYDTMEALLEDQTLDDFKSMLDI